MNFAHVFKFNPYHGDDGRFSSGGGAPARAAGKAAQNLHSSAQKLEPDVTKTLRDSLPAGAQLVGEANKLKTPDSISRKIISNSKLENVDVATAAAGVHDALRYTVQSASDEDYVDTINNTISTLQKQGYTLEKFKNYWSPPSEDSMYEGVNTNFKDKNGNIFEVQFHTKESLDAKGKLHPIYEQFRKDEITKDERDTLARSMFKINQSLKRPKGIVGLKR